MPLLAASRDPGEAAQLAASRACWLEPLPLGWALQLQNDPGNGGVNAGGLTFSVVERPYLFRGKFREFREAGFDFFCLGIITPLC